MKTKLLISVVFILSFLCLRGAEIKSYINRPQHLFIGTPFDFIVEISSDAKDSIFSAAIDTTDVFISRSLKQEDSFENNVKTTKIIHEFSAYDTGEYEFPSLEFIVKSQNGLQTLKTSPFTVVVESVLRDSSQAPADIADLKGVKLGFFDFFLPLAILAVIIFLIGFIVKKLKKEPIIEIKEKKDLRPAFLKALERLGILKSQKLHEQGRFVEFYFETTMILRYFLELEYGFKAMEMTTNEIRRESVLNFDRGLKSEIMYHLQAADRIKYAKGESSLEKAEQELDWLENFLKSFENKNNEEGQNV
ncbi:MAG: hypothetical protein CSB55_05845 [Candidatus Cloacimonadota bacterium]|nr:MAG: hypothetical protein CSB55_05845 [Candidatus Cloacimonadota bacterium]